MMIDSVACFAPVKCEWRMKYHYVHTKSFKGHERAQRDPEEGDELCDKGVWG